MREFLYPARYSPDKKDGGYVVTFRDIPEAITQGETTDEYLEEAAGEGEEKGTEGLNFNQLP
jgi:antitoxin HicB